MPLRMSNIIQFPFLDDAQLPLIPIALNYQGATVSSDALLDSGATVNVLPYDLGIRLGAVWEQQTIRLPLADDRSKR
jgi:hypothetical protein